MDGMGTANSFTAGDPKWVTLQLDVVIVCKVDT
jgi:hypothetical protein